MTALDRLYEEALRSYGSDLSANHDLLCGPEALRVTAAPLHLAEGFDRFVRNLGSQGLHQPAQKVT